MTQKKILIIEDEAPLRETLGDLFEFNGFTVFTAENGSKGCDMIMGQNVDLVVCDVNMPGMNGYEVLSNLTTSTEKGRMPIFLFLTARAQADDIRKGIQLGADGYITKPFESAELLQIVQQHLEKRDRRMQN